MFNKLTNRVKSLFLKKKNTQIETTTLEDLNTTKATEDIKFIIKQTALNVYEVSSPSFLNIKGLGTTPEEAMESFGNNVNNSLDNLIKNTLTLNLNNKEIKDKVRNILSKIQENNSSKKSRFLSKKINKEYIVSLFLKEKLSTEKLIKKFVDKEFSKKSNHIDLTPQLDTTFGTDPSVFFNEGNKLTLKTDKNNQVPFHLLLDPTENPADDPFSFGIFVNLN